MNFKFFICLFVFLLPFCAIAKDITAIGFVEDRRVVDLDGDYIRLAFVRTDSGWGPSCYFDEDEPVDSRSVSEKQNCKSELNNRQWQIIDAKGKYIDVGVLKNKGQWALSNIGHVSFNSLDHKLQFDSSGVLQQTWNGAYPPPLLAVPSGTRVEKVPYQATKNLVSSKIKKRMMSLYFEKKRIKSVCDEKRKIYSEKPATSDDVKIEAVGKYQDGITFYKVLLNTPDSLLCKERDNELEVELMAVKSDRVYSFHKPFQREHWFDIFLTLYNRYVISTNESKDTVYVLLVSGYNRDGYALLDSDLNVKAVSTWCYH